MLWQLKVARQVGNKYVYVTSPTQSIVRRTDGHVRGECVLRRKKNWVEEELEDGGQQLTEGRGGGHFASEIAESFRASGGAGDDGLRGGLRPRRWSGGANPDG